MRLKTEIIRDLNKLASQASLLIALEIFVPNAPVIRIVNNNENIFFRNQEYSCLPFELGEFLSEIASNWVRCELKAGVCVAMRYDLAHPRLVTHFGYMIDG